MHVTDSEIEETGMQTSSIQDDQVIFVRALRGKKRKFKGLKIIASAGPKELDDDSSEDEGDTTLHLESVGVLQSVCTVVVYPSHTH